LAGMLELPGLIDAHVHLREPGAVHKEDSRTGTGAALAGGFTAILDMPNNAPATTTASLLARKNELFAEQAVCDYGLFAGYAPVYHSELPEMARQAVGLKLYLDDTFASSALLANALEAVFRDWPGPGPIAIHADSSTIPAALEYARRFEQHLHICHVPHPDDLLVIDAARQKGQRVTCEVTPHHLFLSSADEARLGAFGCMKPPLLPPKQVQQMWQRLHMVDIIASDHAPHTRAEKLGAAPPPGVPGLETTLPLLLLAVDEGRLTLERLLELLHTTPARIYGLSADTGTLTVELERFVFPETGYQTRCGWSPFAGQSGLGIVKSVMLRAKEVYKDGHVLAQPGAGCSLVSVRV